MKHFLPLKVAVLMGLLSASSCCFPQDENAKDANSAKRFVESLYARYGFNGNPENLSEENASEAFDASLLALVKADAAAAGQGYAGGLDYDPVCNCQETDVKFPGLKTMIELVNANRAMATVRFTIDNIPNRIMLTLVLV
ncbi:MAG: hypothetical protein WA419_03240 [Silvibacterium sp.]